MLGADIRDGREVVDGAGVRGADRCYDHKRPQSAREVGGDRCLQGFGAKPESSIRLKDANGVSGLAHGE